MADSSYDKNQNTIDTNKYSSTILEESADAGQSYVDETLFVGDSQPPPACYRIFNYCSYDNAIGRWVCPANPWQRMLRAVPGLQRLQDDAGSGCLMQPRRVILTFGTNDLSSSYSASSFASDYAKGIKLCRMLTPVWISL